MQRDYWYTVARRADQLLDPVAVGERAGQRTVARLSPRTAPTGTFPVLFAPSQASGLIGHLVGALSGGALYRRASFMLDSMSQQILPDWISLTEQPHIVGGLGSATFDGDGVATSSKSFVQDGRVASYVLSNYSARRLSLHTTGNAGGVCNMDIQGQQTPLGELIRTMRRGLLVTELMGQGVNGVTGDYSRGAAGFWIENGEIAYPVAEVTIAGNLREMYSRVIALGDDVDMRNNIRAPSILIDKMIVAGAS